MTDAIRVWATRDKFKGKASTHVHLWLDCPRDIVEKDKNFKIYHGRQPIAIIDIATYKQLGEQFQIEPGEFKEIIWAVQ